MVSVCIATYNGEKYIKEQLDSILKQLDSTDEIVISDDGSADNTIHEIESLSDSRIKIIYNTGKHNYTSNFENALKHSRGEIIILSDQDDVWCEDKVEVIKRNLIDYDFVTSDALVVNQNLEVINGSFWALRTPGFSAFSDFMKCAYLGCCMAFNRRVLNMALPFPENNELCPHDYWLQLIGSFFFRVKYEKQPLILYRRHSNNVSDAGFSKGVALTEKIHYRLYTLWHLLRRRYGKE